MKKIIYRFRAKIFFPLSVVENINWQVTAECLTDAERRVKYEIRDEYKKFGLIKKIELTRLTQVNL